MALPTIPEEKVPEALRFAVAQIREGLRRARRSIDLLATDETKDGIRRAFAQMDGATTLDEMTQGATRMRSVLLQVARGQRTEGKLHDHEGLRDAKQTVEAVANLATVIIDELNAPPRSGPLTPSDSGSRSSDDPPTSSDSSLSAGPIKPGKRAGSGLGKRKSSMVRYSFPRQARRRIAVSADYRPFGRYEIRVDALRLKSHAIFRTVGSHRAVPGLPALDVSEGLQALLLWMVAHPGAEIKQRVEALTKGDRKTLEHLLRRTGMFGSGLHEKYGHTLTAYASKPLRRFHVVVGEIEAGNNNPEMIREAGALAQQLYSSGRLTRRRYDQIASLVMNMSHG